MGSYFRKETVEGTISLSLGKRQAGLTHAMNGAEMAIGHLPARPEAEACRT
jgi:hypothetical protein